jgi:hypothetical protein
MAEPNNTPRPLPPAAEERTPLLSTGVGESSTQQQGAEQAVQLPSSEAENVESSVSMSRTFRFIKVITYISLICSIICLILFLATYITSEISPYHNYGWHLEDMIALLGIFVWTILSYQPSFLFVAKACHFKLHFTLSIPASPIPSQRSFLIPFYSYPSSPLVYVTQYLCLSRPKL